MCLCRTLQLSDTLASYLYITAFIINYENTFQDKIYLLSSPLLHGLYITSGKKNSLHKYVYHPRLKSCPCLVDLGFRVLRCEVFVSGCSILASNASRFLLTGYCRRDAVGVKLIFS